MNHLTTLRNPDHRVGAGLPWSAPSQAQSEVRMQISSQETYVGMPVTLQIQVEDVEPRPPEFPDVDGLDIRSSGTPSRSSRSRSSTGDEAKAIRLSTVIS